MRLTDFSGEVFEGGRGERVTDGLFSGWRRNGFTPEIEASLRGLVAKGYLNVPGPEAVEVSCVVEIDISRSTIPPGGFSAHCLVTFPSLPGRHQTDEWTVSNHYDEAAHLPSGGRRLTDAGLVVGYLDSSKSASKWRPDAVGR